MQVANGYRRPIPPQWPSSLHTLVETCWAMTPEKRPAMKLVLRTLKDLQSKPEELRMLDPQSGGSSMASGLARMNSSRNKKGCCVVM